jgi:hypothetical protein
LEALLENKAVEQFRVMDAAFLVVLAAALCLVVFVGRVAYQEALLTETAKATAEGLQQWFDKAAEAHAQGQPNPLEDCSSEGEKTWEQCRKALAGTNGPLHGLSNPFDPSLGVIGPKCEKGNLNTRGLVVVEKGTPAPPGAPPSVSFGPFEDSDKLTREMPARILVCDKGGYALKVAEVKL